jgi:pimeloyl-ACP methyl ester carboxylesterase
MRSRLLTRAALLCAALALAACQTDLPLAGLKTRYGAAPSRFLPMDGLEVHWRDEGPNPATSPGDTEPPAILLLHGTASSLHTWDGWARALSPHMRVVRLDLPGFGLTGPHPSGDYSAQATLDFLERFASAAGLKRFAIAGNSLGGQYAWRFALRHPEQISALILVDAAGYPADSSVPGSLGLRWALTPFFSELLRWAPVDSVMESSLKSIYADRSKVTPALSSRYADLMRRPGNRAALGDRARTQGSATGWEDVHTLKVPTLIQWGALDPWFPPVMGERFKRDIRDSQLIVYPNLGHLPMEEDPDLTARDALEFLMKVKRSASRSH